MWRHCNGTHLSHTLCCWVSASRPGMRTRGLPVSVNRHGCNSRGVFCIHLFLYLIQKENWQTFLCWNRNNPEDVSQCVGLLTRYVKLWVAHVPGEPGTFSSAPRVNDPEMHHGTCVTHVPWCMPGPLPSGFLWTVGRGENVPGISGACTTRNFTYLVRGPWLLMPWLYVRRQWLHVRRQVVISQQ